MTPPRNKPPEPPGPLRTVLRLPNPGAVPGARWTGLAQPGGGGAQAVAMATADASAPTLKPASRSPAKATAAADCAVLEQIPNIGPALADDLRRIGIHHPRELAGKDAFVLYQHLCAATGQRHDPCVLDTFMAATDFMRGAPAAPWWHYTSHRKALFGQIEMPVRPDTPSDTQASTQAGINSGSHSRAKVSTAPPSRLKPAPTASMLQAGEPVARSHWPFRALHGNGRTLKKSKP